MLCSLVKTAGQFRRDGCENCEEVLSLRGAPSKIMECTSSNFDGLVAMMKPDGIFFLYIYSKAEMMRILGCKVAEDRQVPQGNLCSSDCRTITRLCH